MLDESWEADYQSEKFSFLRTKLVCLSDFQLAILCKQPCFASKITIINYILFKIQLCFFFLYFDTFHDIFCIIHMFWFWCDNQVSISHISILILNKFIFQNIMKLKILNEFRAKTPFKWQTFHIQHILTWNLKILKIINLKW